MLNRRAGVEILQIGDARLQRARLQRNRLLHFPPRDGVGNKRADDEKHNETDKPPDNPARQMRPSGRGLAAEFFIIFRRDRNILQLIIAGRLLVLNSPHERVGTDLLFRLRCSR